MKVLINLMKNPLPNCIVNFFHCGRHFLVKNNRGFSYVEVLVATVLLAVCLVPALDALQSAIQGTTAGVNYSTDQARVQSRMEEVLAEKFSLLLNVASVDVVPTPDLTYSDPGGTAVRLLVYLSRYDIDNADADANPFTGGDSELIWVRVEIENSGFALEALTSIY